MASEWSLLDLPSEILVKIFMQLDDLTSVTCLAATCSQLELVSRSESIWRLWLHRKFPKAPVWYAGQLGRPNPQAVNMEPYSSVAAMEKDCLDGPARQAFMLEKKYRRMVAEEKEKRGKG